MTAIPGAEDPVTWGYVVGAVVLVVVGVVVVAALVALGWAADALLDRLVIRHTPAGRGRGAVHAQNLERPRPGAVTDHKEAP